MSRGGVQGAASRPCPPPPPRRGPGCARLRGHDGNANKRTHGATEQDITAEEVLEFYRSRTES